MDVEWVMVISYGDYAVIETGKVEAALSFSKRRSGDRRRPRLLGLPFAAWPGAAFCAVTESAPASVIRTLSSTSEYLPGRARSILAANISNGLQACSYSDHPPTASSLGTIHLCATGPGKLVLA